MQNDSHRPQSSGESGSGLTRLFPNRARARGAEDHGEAKRGGFEAGWPVVALMAACAALRVPSLRALPIFCDEAIYLHGARILRQDPFRHLWISLLDRTPPVHVWLLALFLPLARDPVLAGRLFSVIASVLTIPALYALCRSLDGSGSRAPAFLTCALYAASPLFVLHDRMARVESLFVLEMSIVAWLSVRLAAAARHGRPIVSRALGLGAALGLAMLTRQAVSYALGFVAAAAWFVPAPPQGGSRRSFGRFVGALALAGTVALALWVPMLLAKDGPPLSTRILAIEAVHDPASAEGLLAVTRENAAHTLSWLLLYLTPPVAVLCALGAAWLALSGRGRLSGFLAAWAAFLLLPMLPLANAFVPRYLLPAAVPLLVAGGFALEGMTRRASAPIAVAVTAVILAWPLTDTCRQLADWKSQRLAEVDRWQFVSGWAAGYATEAAAAHLRGLGAGGPVIVVTPPDSGNPADTLWLTLDGAPGVTLAASRGLELPLFDQTLSPPILRFWGDVRRGSPVLDLSADSHTSVLFVSREKLYTKEGLVRAADYWRRFHPSLRVVARFENPPFADGTAGDAVVLLAIR